MISEVEPNEQGSPIEVRLFGIFVFIGSKAEWQEQNERIGNRWKRLYWLKTR